MSSILSVVAIALINGVQAHSDPSMTDSGMNGTDMGGMASGGMMLPWMHFSLGDSLWFESWVPQTKGAMAGSAIGLFLLAIIERWIAATRGVMEIYWRRRLDAMLAARFAPLGDDNDKEKGISSKTDLSDINILPTHLLTNSRPVSRVANLRAIAPFVPSHDIVRGMFQAVQAALGFSFMLAIMMFQGAWFIAICLGLGVGEMLFGRFASLASNGH